MLKNYKIKVNNEAESREVISLLVQLGYKSYESNRFGIIYTIGRKIGCDSLAFWDYYTTQGCQELTLPQLRDLVVLNRNDVKDATHDGTIHKYYKADSKWYYFDSPCKRWIESSGGKQEFYNKLMPIQEQGLISGADAKLAWARGEDVQLKQTANVYSWRDIDPRDTLSIFEDEDFIFRLKPRTIKLEIEIPAPFEPKQSDLGLIDIYYLDANQSDGWNADHFDEHFDDDLIQFGAWRTEEEIKQVVAALRGGIKG